MAQPTLEAPKSLRDIFPPVRKSHILNCSFASWHPIYRPITPKARTIPLTPEFLNYLREDGIVLPDDEEQITTLSDSEEDSEGETEDEEGEEGETPRVLNPTERFPELHERIKQTMRELGGKISPKLNWSSPKDAAFMTATNTLECRTPGEVYLLLKSSDFITHDLEHAFQDCVDEDEDELEDEESSKNGVGNGEIVENISGELKKDGEKEQKITPETIPYHLVLRKWFLINPSMEFRVFVSSRRILAITQRDLNHYDFLPDLRPSLIKSIQNFFTENLQPTFPDPDYVFDVYIPHTEIEEKRRVWLIDINPFAPRTDTILFSWVEILRLRNGEKEEGEVELRLVNRDDPEAYQFATPQYGASKLPRDVVDAGLEGEEAVWEFARRWREIVDKAEEARGERATAATARP